LRISARAVSAERVGPAIVVGLLSGLLSSGMFTFPALAEGAGTHRLAARWSADDLRKDQRGQKFPECEKFQ
jgi:hypothetical protein